MEIKEKLIKMLDPNDYIGVCIAIGCCNCAIGAIMESHIRNFMYRIKWNCGGWTMVTLGRIWRYLDKGLIFLVYGFNLNLAYINTCASSQATKKQNAASLS